MLRLVHVRVLLTAASAGSAGGTFSVGSDQLRFEVANASQARWGCLSGVHIGGDPQPTENGALRAGDAGTPLWRLTATSCNTKDRNRFPGGP